MAVPSSQSDVVTALQSTGFVVTALLWGWALAAIIDHQLVTAGLLFVVASAACALWALRPDSRIGPLLLVVADVAGKSVPVVRGESGGRGVGDARLGQRDGIGTDGERVRRGQQRHDHHTSADPEEPGREPGDESRRAGGTPYFDRALEDA